MISDFSVECLDFYKFLCSYEDADKEVFLQQCIKERLGDLLESNSQKLDSTLDQLEQYIDNIITDKPSYERCSNYKERTKSLTAYNINFISRILKKYTKIYIASSQMLNRLCQNGGD